MESELSGPREGLVLSGRYVLERELGRGGMGSVWRARQTVLDSVVAVKVLSSELRAADARQRFLVEAKAAASLNSPHIIKLFDYGVDRGLAFLVMELLEGESLSELLDRHGKLPAPLVSELCAQVARGLTQAHARGVVHRDLKPDNIFVVPNDGAPIAKLLDFGIAKSDRSWAGEAALETQSGMLLGTPYYMSPEQIDRPREVTWKSDVWALGVIVYECLVGQRPFDADTLTALLRGIVEGELPQPPEDAAVPPGFDAWFARACARDVASRFETAKEAAAALALVCRAEEPVPSSLLFKATHPTLQTHAGSPARTGNTASPVSSERHQEKRSRVPLWAAAGALGVAAWGGIAWLGHREPPAPPEATALSAPSSDGAATAATAATSASSASAAAEDSASPEVPPPRATSPAPEGLGPREVAPALRTAPAAAVTAPHPAAAAPRDPGAKRPGTSPAPGAPKKTPASAPSAAPSPPQAPAKPPTPTQTESSGPRVPLFLP